MDTRQKPPIHPPGVFRDTCGRRIVLLALCLLVAAVYAFGNEPRFQTGVKLKAGGAEINIPRGHLVPVAVDWNGDKKKDLLVGHYYDTKGNIKLYLNRGTDAKPRFTKAVSLKAGGAYIRLNGT